MEFEVALAAFGDGFAGFAGAAPAFHGGDFAFEFLVDGEEVFHLAADVGEDLVHGVDLVVAGVAGGDGEDFLVFLVGVDHVEDADGADFDEDAGEAGLLDEDEAVEGIVVVGEGAGDEAVVAGVMEGGIEGAVEAEDAQVAVVLVLIRRVLGDFDDHSDDFRRVGAGFEVVEAVHGFSVSLWRGSGSGCGGEGASGYSTETMVSPLAGTVAPDL